MHPMRSSITALLGIVLSISPINASDDSPQPLDMRTRCIVRFRECLLLVAEKDVAGVFSKIADGHGEGSFTFHRDLDALSPDLKRELADVDRFFNHNFRRAAEINERFDKIRFASLQTHDARVKLKDVAQQTEHEAKLLTMKIEVPEFRDPDGGYSVLRFVEFDGRLYWVPFGW